MRSGLGRGGTGLGRKDPAVGTGSEVESRGNLPADTGHTACQYCQKESSKRFNP